MLKLEHLLKFHAHEKCMNGASSLGIHHLSALSNVEIKIRGDRDEVSVCHYISTGNGIVGW